MCSTPFGIRDSTRNSCEVRERTPWCSTPFGIRDSTHFSLPKSGDRQNVLNAFRHQRFDTRARAIATAIARACSTPFGIRDSTLFWAEYFISSVRGAQRLSASEIRHGTSFHALIRAITRCSTPFGIRDSTHFPDYSILASAVSAQRLSASEIRHTRL